MKRCSYQTCIHMGFIISHNQSPLRGDGCAGGTANYYGIRWLSDRAYGCAAQAVRNVVHNIWTIPMFLMYITSLMYVYRETNQMVKYSLETRRYHRFLYMRVALWYEIFVPL